MRRFATIKDIAKALGISVATVSRALRDAYDVSPQTRKLVLEKAEEMHYKPNFNATGLVKSSTHKIGVIIPAITNYYFSTVITGIQEVAQSKGYNIILYITNDSPELEKKIVYDLSLSSLDGLLACVSSPSDACKHFQELIDDGLPVVFFDRVPEEINISKVMQDDYNGAYQAVKHLIEKGYEKIAHITGPKGVFLTENRLRGYQDALQDHNLALDNKWVVYSGFSQKDGESDVAQLFTENLKTPDAIFAVNDRKAIGAMVALKRKNIRIGAEVGVIGFTNDPICEIISPTLSTVAEPAYEIGRKSCELLLTHIKKSTFIGEEVVLSGELIVRESTSRV
ncbi:LacI family DNA-binding transcriptional regulator [Dyadobacter psychrophilus]|uniref:Transcriptional regulator, LacI family n=1 Tax=Dyadobacter psychrophilus TaxID=651661 RepID=A0A1T5GM87_9BACT|nr:LacI family DNA-binding transcriptional regulator [Dyadobacter psychrophilus]SKC09522.1 transcriptional regulator, LacI family [Dyadobacter psychrophilus]